MIFVWTGAPHLSAFGYCPIAKDAAPLMVWAAWSDASVFLWIIHYANPAFSYASVMNSKQRTSISLMSAGFLGIHTRWIFWV